MKLFETLLDGQGIYEAVCANLEGRGRSVSLFGLSPIHRSLLCVHLAKRFAGRTLLFLTENESEGRRCVADINSFAQKELAAFYPARDFVFGDVAGASREFETERLGVLGRLSAGELAVVVTCADGLAQYTLPKEALASHTKVLTPETEFAQKELINLLESSGYARREQVEGVCQYAVRGGIVDFFAPTHAAPVRVEYWGDEIDSISNFSVETQRRTSSLEQVPLPPARELLFSNQTLTQVLTELLEEARKKRRQALCQTLEKELEQLAGGLALAAQDKYYHRLYQTPATLLDYCQNPLILISDLQGVSNRLQATCWQSQEDVKALLKAGVMPPLPHGFYMEQAELLERFCANGVLLLDTFAKGHTLVPAQESFTLDAGASSPWGGLLSAILEDIRYELHRGYCVLIAVKTQRAGQALVADLQKEGVDATFVNRLADLTLGRVFVLEGNFSSGFTLPDLRCTLITQGQSAKGGFTARKTAKHKVKKEAMFGSLADLTVGDLVVHVTYGIGVFCGITKMQVGGLVKDYIKIQYAESGVLYLPVNQLDLVSRYLGGKDAGHVKLSRLGGTDWEKTKQRVKTAVRQMAKELIDLYAKRLNAPGHAFAPDDNFCQEFDARFEYEETEDQLRSVAEIKGDMEKASPMDRLLCGDVGFGKTEVALRAAFKCMYEGKQCVLLVPTTILAWQHYQTALRRFEGYPFRIEILSRFRKPKEQAEIIKALAKGEVDLVIGTHRLVQKDVAFADLGLAIIDEEQRFGVAHKERFKQQFHGVDMLTLSATPIPRTLNMAMSGIRDMSVIEQAPMDRQPVQTYVCEFSEPIVAEAIKKELRRGGQVFYLHNDVESILDRAADLAKLVPEARIDIGHGKMSEEELGRVWERLVAGETDVLVCTTIIETGVDVPNCNTLIVDNADKLGLSQLYQLRGRVGRSARRAFAYFTFARGKVLSEVATKRLNAIREFTNFGAGFQIAMRDLQIRGAGSVLGASQHGHMEQVGYDMYLRLLEQAVQEERGEAPAAKVTDCLVDLRRDAHIPEEYITSYGQRIEIYKKIAAIATREDLMDVTDELIDRFGEPPKAVEGLMQVALLRGRAIAQQITEIRQNQASLLFYLADPRLEKIQHVVKGFHGRVLVNSGAKAHLAVRLKEEESPLEVMEQVLSRMEEVE